MKNLSDTSHWSLEDYADDPAHQMTTEKEIAVEVMVSDKTDEESDGEQEYGSPICKNELYVLKFCLYISVPFITHHLVLKFSHAILTSQLSERLIFVTSNLPKRSQNWALSSSHSAN
jgi:hypothetical protein